MRMPFITKENLIQWLKDSLYEGTILGICKECGCENNMEPDAETCFCSFCNEVTKHFGLRTFGLI